MIHLLNISLFPLIILIKIKLILKIGIINYFRMKRISFSSFPNGLVPMKRISQGGYTIEKILGICPIKPSQYTPAKKIDLMINFQDYTYSLLNIEEYISKQNFPNNLNEIICINLNCNDISKTKVSKVHKKVFQYRIDVDPLKFHGKAVEKSDINGLHDGKIIQCPIKKSQLLKNKVYNIFIDTKHKNHCYQYRVFYINKVLPFMYVTKKLAKLPFSGASNSIKTYMVKTKDYFSSKEINQIQKFFKEFKCDMGEVDILRDRNSGLIYIVDLSNTPGMNSKVFSLKDKMLFIYEISFGFFNNIVLPIIRKENPLKDSTIEIKKY